jgi:hypothetical protein
MKMTMAKAERKQQEAEAGIVSAHFPEVASVVVSMTYKQMGVLEPFQRTVNFFPSSYAIFMVNCLNEGCVGGGFDFSRIVTTMVRDLKSASRGKLRCKGCGPNADFSNVVYEIAIRYI